MRLEGVLGDWVGSASERRLSDGREVVGGASCSSDGLVNLVQAGGLGGRVHAHLGNIEYYPTQRWCD